MFKYCQCRNCSTYSSGYQIVLSHRLTLRRLAHLHFCSFSSNTDPPLTVASTGRGESQLFLHPCRCDVIANSKSSVHSLQNIKIKTHDIESL